MPILRIILLSLCLVLAGQAAGVDVQKADLPTLLAQAEANDKVAMYKLSVVYYEGELVPKDLKKSVKWLRASADLFFAPAMDVLARCYIDGIGLPKDEKEGVKWYQKAADMGFDRSQHTLSLIYLGGDYGLKKDFHEAHKWASLAAEQGLPAAKCTLAIIYLAENSPLKNDALGEKWLKQAAFDGDKLAAWRMSLCYYQGLLFKKDEVESLAWVQVAAAQKYAKATTFLPTFEEKLGKEKSAKAKKRSREILATIDENAANKRLSDQASNDDKPLLTDSDGGKSMIPPVFDQLHSGMPWAEVLALLPGARPIKAAPGESKTLSPDQPRDDMMCQLSDNTGVSAWFIDQKLVRYSFAYAPTDASLAGKLKAELLTRLGPPTKERENGKRKEYLWINQDFIYKHVYDSSEKQALIFTTTKAENATDSGKLQASPKANDGSTDPLLPSVFLRLRVGMTWAEAFDLLPGAKPIRSYPTEPATLTREKPVKSIYHTLSETDCVIVNFRNGKISSFMTSYDRLRGSFETRLMKEIIARYGEPTEKKPNRSGTDNLDWIVGDLLYSYIEPNDGESAVIFGVMAASDRKRGVLPQTRTAQNVEPTPPKRKGDVLVPAVYWQVQPQMTWAEVLALLPDAQAYSTLNGKFPTLSPDQPREDMAVRFSSNEVFVLFFGGGKLHSATLHLHNTDRAYSEALDTELKERLGAEPEKIISKDASIKGSRWLLKHLVYQNLTAPNGTDRLVTLISRSDFERANPKTTP